MIRIRKLAIFCHRWMGLAFCLLFTWWFASGIGLLYWDVPSVSQSDRLERSQTIDPAAIRLSPDQAFAKLPGEGTAEEAQLAVFDGRPVYRFNGPVQTLVYADDGTVQGEYSRDLLLRIASLWTGMPASTPHVQEVTTADQWTLQVNLRAMRPVWKYTFPDGQQVYISGKSGEVIQYTTLKSRIEAHLGPIPHWLYYTPLRTRQKLWSNIVIWASGLGTVMALMGLIAGLSLYSASKKYCFGGAPTSIPYTGSKRLHMILGLFFGVVTCTWSFSGMLSMEPFPVLTNRGSGIGELGGSAIERIQQALSGDRFRLADFVGKSPQAALAQLGALNVRQLNFTYFDRRPVAIAC